jgi:hypothetical protein
LPFNRVHPVTSVILLWRSLKTSIFIWTHVAVMSWQCTAFRPDNSKYVIFSRFRLHQTRSSVFTHESHSVLYVFLRVTRTAYVQWRYNDRVSNFGRVGVVFNSVSQVFFRQQFLMIFFVSIAVMHSLFSRTFRPWIVGKAHDIAEWLSCPDRVESWNDTHKNPSS